MPPRFSLGPNNCRVAPQTAAPSVTASGTAAGSSTQNEFGSRNAEVGSEEGELEYWSDGVMGFGRGKWRFLEDFMTLPHSAFRSPISPFTAIPLPLLR